MKFELFKGLIIVPVTFVYKASKIETQGVIDTGSAGTALDINLVKLDFTRPSSIVEIVGIGGSQDVLLQMVEEVTFNTATVKNFQIEFGDVTNIFGFDAIVGGDLLDALGICIDYENRGITSKRKTS